VEANMKGENELVLNQATIVEAVQEYLCKRMHAAPDVVSVRMRTDEMFSVRLSSERADASDAT
jgi:hypothetical protein